MSLLRSLGTVGNAVWLLIRYGPAFYKMVKELLKQFDGDKKKVKECLDGKCSIE